MVSQIDSQIVAREVLASEIHYLQGKVYLGGHNTKIKIMDVHKKLSCTALKNKQDLRGRMQRTEIEYTRVLNSIKISVNVSLEKKVAEYETKDFQKLKDIY